MLKRSLENSLLDKIFLIVSFFYLISAINNPFLEINITSINGLITTLRGIAPYVMAPILIGYLLLIKKNLKLEWIYCLFLIYLFGQFLGYLINPLGLPYHINYQDQIYWLVCNFSTLLYFYIIRENKNFNILILKLFICVISIIAIKFVIDVYIEFFEYFNKTQKVRNFFYNLSSMSPNRLFLEQPVPRSSGLSRMLIIPFLLLYIQLFFLKFEKKRTIFYTIIIGFLVFTLFNLQNRISIFYILILFLFTLFFKLSSISLKKRIFYALCIFIVPFMLHLHIQQGTLALIKYYNKFVVDKKIENIVSDKIEKEKTEKKEIEKKIEIEKKERKKEPEVITGIKKQRLFLKSSTGRKDLWDKTIELFLINKFLGHGPQADRDLLSENVSSLYFYSMLCGGIISLIAVILITLILFFKSIKMIFIKNIFTSKQIYACFSLLAIGYLYLRTIVEISFGVFGIDMILFFITFNILRKSESY